MELAGQRKIIEIDAGLFLITYATAESAERPPTIKISPEKASAKHVTLILHPDQQDALLWQPGCSLVVRATEPAKLSVEAHPEQKDDSAVASLNVEALTQGNPLAQGNPVHLSRNREKPTPLDFSDAKVLGHVAGIGDVVVGPTDWIGGPSAPSRIEGISILWPTKPQDLDIRYSVKLAKPLAISGQLAKLGSFAGTRGRAVPIIGVTLEMSGTRALTCQFIVEAVFLGSPIKRSTGTRIVLSGPTNREPLVGLRIGVEERASPIVVPTSFVRAEPAKPVSTKQIMLPAPTQVATDGQPRPYAIKRFDRTAREARPSHHTTTPLGSPSINAPPILREGGTKVQPVDQITLPPSPSADAPPNRSDDVNHPPASGPQNPSLRNIAPTAPVTTPANAGEPSTERSNSEGVGPTRSAVPTSSSTSLEQAPLPADAPGPSISPPRRDDVGAKARSTPTSQSTSSERSAEASGSSPSADPSLWNKTGLPNHPTTTTASSASPVSELPAASQSTIVTRSPVVASRTPAVKDISSTVPAKFDTPRAASHGINRPFSGDASAKPADRHSPAATSMQSNPKPSLDQPKLETPRLRTASKADVEVTSHDKNGSPGTNDLLDKSLFHLIIELDRLHSRVKT